MPVLAPAPSVPSPLTYSGRYLSIGDVTMSSGSGTVDDAGLRWLLESVTGWDNPPASTAEATNRAGAAGADLAPGYDGPRLLTVVGSVAGDWATTNAAYRRLMSQIPVSDLATMVIGGAGPDMQAKIRRNGEPLATGNQSALSFSLALIAPDPLRYGTTALSQDTGLPRTVGGLSLPLSLPLSVGATSASGRLTLINEGDKETPVLLGIAGPCPPCAVTHLGSGKRLVIPDAIPAGTTLILDSAKGQALLDDGTTIRFVSGYWFNLDPVSGTNPTGVNEIAFSAASYEEAARLFVTYRPAWE
jgi:hypothetical protein